MDKYMSMIGLLVKYMFRAVTLRTYMFRVCTLGKYMFGVCTLGKCVFRVCTLGKYLFMVLYALLENTCSGQALRKYMFRAGTVKIHVQGIYENSLE